MHKSVEGFKYFEEEQQPQDEEEEEQQQQQQQHQQQQNNNKQTNKQTDKDEDYWLYFRVSLAHRVDADDYSDIVPGFKLPFQINERRNEQQTNG